MLIRRLDSPTGSLRQPGSDRIVMGRREFLRNSAGLFVASGTMGSAACGIDAATVLLLLHVVTTLLPVVTELLEGETEFENSGPDQSILYQLQLRRGSSIDSAESNAVDQADLEPQLNTGRTAVPWTGLTPPEPGVYHTIAVYRDMLSVSDDFEVARS